MTEQDHKNHVEAWLAEAGDEPTAFDKAVLKVAHERGFLGLLGLEDEYTAMLVDHLAGVEDALDDGRDFVQAVARALGLDPYRPGDREPCAELAYAHLFKELYRT